MGFAEDDVSYSDCLERLSDILDVVENVVTNPEDWNCATPSGLSWIISVAQHELKEIASLLPAGLSAKTAAKGGRR